MPQKIVISGVNIVNGGPLSIYKDCLHTLLNWQRGKFEVIALVNNVQLFTEFDKNCIQFIEFPGVKKRWLSRIIFEYYTCLKISKKIRPHIWFSIHDTTPNVIADKRIVYCHNPSPFYKIKFKEAVMEKSLLFFNLFYRTLYGINLKRNNYVIVQQDWIRVVFKKWYALNNIVVAYPVLAKAPKTLMTYKKPGENFIFLYPALARAFKNFEVLLLAAQTLYAANKNFEVIITIDGQENKYTRRLFSKFGNLPYIKFIGIQSRNCLSNLYRQCSCLVFPSKLETWGLPISEVKMYEKPILIADEKYAYETINDYNKAVFFNAGDSRHLAGLMKSAIEGRLDYKNTSGFKKPDALFAENWEKLFDIVLS